MQFPAALGKSSRGGVTNHTVTHGVDENSTQHFVYWRVKNNETQYESKSAYPKFSVDRPLANDRIVESVYMKLVNFLSLAVFVAFLLSITFYESVMLNVVAVNVFGYVWGGQIRKLSGSYLLWCWLLFIACIGPLTYLGYGAVRDEMIYRGYSQLLVHAFQPLAALCVPFAFSTLKFRWDSPVFDAKQYITQSIVGVCFILPLWIVFLTTILGWM